MVFVLLLFPTGSLPSRRWRPVAWAGGAAIAAWALSNAFAPTVITTGSPPVRNPMGVAGPAGHVFGILAAAGAALIVLTGLAAVGSLAFRYRRAGPVEREQLKWLVYAAGLIVVAELAAIPIEQIVGPGSDAANNLENAVGSGAVALVPVAIGIAIFRYRLYDIDVVINKSLVYGSLAVFITAVYVAIVVGIGSLAQHGAGQNLGLSIGATAVVAVAFQPVRERIQRLANRLVYGRRATPYEVLADFAGRMAGTYAVPRGHVSLFLWMPWVGFFSGVFGLFTMYLPPLFPTLLRTTGAGFSYNIGRIVAAFGTIFFGLFAHVGDFRHALLFNSFLLLPAMFVALMLPDLKDVDPVAEI